MKRNLTLCLTLLLAGSSVALAGAGPASNYDQDGSGNRARRGTLQGRGFLGVDLDEVTRESASRLKLRDERGALVTYVIGESSAAKAGLQKDDVIVKWDGEAIESAAELWRHMRETPAGRGVRLGVIRDGSEREVAVTLGDRADYAGRARLERERVRDRVRPVRERVQRERPERELRERMSPGYRMGVSLQGMSPQLAEYFGVSNHNGALVVYVHPDSPAAKAGIKAGDVIISVAGQAVERPLSVHQILKGRSEGPTEIKVMRDKQERAFTVQVEAEKVSSWVYSPGNFDDVVVEVPNIIAPRVTIPHIAAPRMVAPLVVVPNIAPLHSFKYRYSVPAVAPMAPPKITIPKMTIPRIKIAPMKITPLKIAPIKITPMKMAPIRIVVPYKFFVNPV